MVHVDFSMLVPKQSNFVQTLQFLFSLFCSVLLPATLVFHSLCRIVLNTRQIIFCLDFLFVRIEYVVLLLYCADVSMKFIFQVLCMCDLKRNISQSKFIKRCCEANESHVSQEEFIDVLTESRAKSKSENYMFRGFSSRQYC